MRAATAILGFSMLCGSALAAPMAGEGVGLLAHRAVYQLTLGKTSGPKAPAAASGMIVYDFSGSACEGYAMKFRQRTELQPEEGVARASDMSSTTFEDADGSNFRFRIETSHDGGGTELLDGAAARAGGGLSISIKQPQREKLDIGEDVAFPTVQTLRMLKAARAGDSTLELKVYDGTDTGKKLYDTLTVIGKARPAPATEAAAQNDALKGVPRWPVSISYFEQGKGDAPPAYVLSFDMYENGVSRALKLDYGDFTLNGEMTSFEVLPGKPCAK